MQTVDAETRKALFDWSKHMPKHGAIREELVGYSQTGEVSADNMLGLDTSRYFGDRLDTSDVSAAGAEATRDIRNRSIVTPDTETMGGHPVAALALHRDGAQHPSYIRGSKRQRELWTQAKEAAFKARAEYVDAIARVKGIPTVKFQDPKLGPAYAEAFQMTTEDLSESPGVVARDKKTQFAAQATQDRTGMEAFNRDPVGTAVSTLWDTMLPEDRAQRGDVMPLTDAEAARYGYDEDINVEGLSQVQLAERNKTLMADLATKEQNMRDAHQSVLEMAAPVKYDVTSLAEAAFDNQGFLKLSGPNQIIKLDGATVLDARTGQSTAAGYTFRSDKAAGGSVIHDTKSGMIFTAGSVRVRDPDSEFGGAGGEREGEFELSGLDKALKAKDIWLDRVIVLGQSKSDLPTDK